MPKARKPSSVIQVRHPSEETGDLKFLGGSASDGFNTILANQVTNALWLARADEDERQKRMSAAVAGLAGTRPGMSWGACWGLRSSRPPAPPWSPPAAP